MNRYLCFIQELTPLLKQINMVAVVIAKRTLPRHTLTKSGQPSAKPEYVQIEGAPLVVTSFENNLFTLNPLTSAEKKNFAVTKEELQSDFYPAELDENKFITNLDSKKYPKPVNITEFSDRDRLAKFNTEIMKEIKSWSECPLKELLIGKLDSTGKKRKGGKLSQLRVGQGCTKTPTITAAQAHIEKMNGEKELTLKEKHFGEPLFNRSSRCSPVVDHLSWEEYRASPSYPYPIGIRNKDFCLPSEMIAVSVEMIRQLLTLKNVEDKYREKIQKIFTDFNIEPQFNNFVTHRCTYCGEEIDLNEYSSNYASETNYIEICHRDPNACFCMGNMYWGHGECNRRQGGYTETERIEDALGLINYNPTDYSPELLLRLKDSIDKALVLHSTQSD